MTRPRRAPPLRVELPDPTAVDMLDAMGRRVRGRTAAMRRLYAEDRCNVEEIAAYFGVNRYVVSAALRNKGAHANRRHGLKQYGRGLVRVAFTRDPITRACRRWQAPTWACARLENSL